MNKAFISIISLFVLLSGCSSYTNTLGLVFDNNRASLENYNNYSIYYFKSTINGICDQEEQVPAHYQIYIPPKVKK